MSFYHDEHEIYVEDTWQPESFIEWHTAELQVAVGREETEQ